MSIAKTLIQKEIARYKRGIKLREIYIKGLNDALNDKSLKKDEKDIFLKAISNGVAQVVISDEAIKELETDLKKL